MQTYIPTYTTLSLISNTVGFHCVNRRCGNLGAVESKFLSPGCKRTQVVDRPLSWEGINELHLRFNSAVQQLKILTLSVSTFKSS